MKVSDTMATLGMRGPFSLDNDVINEVIEGKSPGNYAPCYRAIVSRGLIKTNCIHLSNIFYPIQK